MPSTLTVGQFKTEIRSAFGGRTDFDSRLTIAINLAQDAMSRMHDFDELKKRTTVNTAVTGSAANDKIISISALGRYKKIYDIRLYASNALDRKLIRVMPRRWDKIVPKAEYYSRGTPTHYMIWQRTEIEVYRVPDAVYTMHFRYTVWPTAAGADGSNLDLENMDDMIIHLAASYLALSAGHTARSNELYRVFANRAKDVFLEDIDDYDTHIAQQGSEIRSSMGSLGYNDPFVRDMP